jgi:RNA polymerase sigma-70 factor (ECF subfamily)
LLDETLVLAQIRNGQAEAFADIVGEYHMPVRRYLYRLTGDFDLAEDLTQDTFLQAYKGILKTDKHLILKPWLYRIATNNAWQHKRRKKLTTSVTEKWVSEIGRNRGGVEGSNEERIEIQEALSRIPKEQRACMVLHLIEGFKYAEIGRVLEISEDAVRKRVSRGKDEFKRLYGLEGQLQ